MATNKSILQPWLPAHRYAGHTTDSIDGAPVASFDKRLHGALIDEEFFVRLIRLERRKTERSGKRFMLALISSEDFRAGVDDLTLNNIVASVSASTRETDLLGWYERDATLGLLMTEIGEADKATIDTIVQKVSVAVTTAVKVDRVGRLSLTFRLFPQDHAQSSRGESDRILYPDVAGPRQTRRRWCVLKRAVDVAGSILALTVFLPLYVLIALLVASTSEGPVLFCQQRVGQYGKHFTLYKFRTMYAHNDPRAHREYVARLIAGGSDVSHNGLFKISNDPRVTIFGRILRKTSLDELPQFVNVLMNDMSLVGPRPPIPYEFDHYQLWHKRRVLEVKPGLTGLWQVEGRSRTTFDEMVRMDLRYARISSLAIDVRILIRTPAAMLSGRGAC